MKVKIILTICLAVAALTLSHAQSFPLEQGVVCTVESVRTWESFDGKAPEEGPYQKWKSDSAVSYASHRYSPDYRTPEGKFVEILVWFDAEGAEDAKVHLIPGADDTLEAFDARLAYGEGQSCPIKAFAIPGTGVVKNNGLLETWDGNLNFGLAPGERTWILLLFDIPADVSEAIFQLKSAEPLPINIL